MERIGAESFDQERLERPGTWIVAFLADWCPFCRRFVPDFTALEGEADYHLAVADVTSEESPLWETFRIDVVPTVVVFRDGRAVYRSDGILGVGLPRGALEKVRLAAVASHR